MNKIIIKQNDVNIRIDKFIKKIFPNLSKILIFKFIRTKKIKVNNNKVSINYLTCLNDEITFYFAYTRTENNNEPIFLKANEKLEIVYEDANIIVVDKPINLIVNDVDNKQCDTLINRVLKYLYNKNEYDYKNELQFKPSLAHRIDQNTSGLVIIAKNMAALQEMNYIFKEKLITKKYCALVYGIIPNNHGIIECYIKKEPDKNIVKVSKNKLDNEYKLAITKYWVVNSYKNKYSYIDIELITGRTHQIRASFNFINYPLVGEQKYISKQIDKDPRYKYQCLKAYQLTFKEINFKTLSYLSSKTIKTKIDDFKCD